MACIKLFLQSNVFIGALQSLYTFFPFYVCRRTGTLSASRYDKAYVYAFTFSHKGVLLTKCCFKVGKIKASKKIKGKILKLTSISSC